MSDLTEHLEGMADSLDESVDHEDIHRLLMEAVAMSREVESVPTVPEYYGEETLLCIEIDWSEPLLPRLVGPFTSREVAEKWATTTIANGSWSFAHVHQPAPVIEGADEVQSVAD